MQMTALFSDRLRAALAGLFLAAFLATPATAFDFDDVAARAAEQAKKPYRPLTRKPPPELAALTYDQHRDIRFRPEHALWRKDDVPFELMFFHLGKFQLEPVLINEVTPQGVRHIRYRSADFDRSEERRVGKECRSRGPPYQ